MTEEVLRALIARGEGQRTEFKAVEADAADLARAVSALANSGGGTLLLGVGDDGSIRALVPPGAQARGQACSASDGACWTTPTRSSCATRSRTWAALSSSRPATTT